MMKKRKALSYGLTLLLVALTTLLPVILFISPVPQARAADSGWHSPSADVADTGGDGDGFEVFPGGAYSDGGEYARNAGGAGDRHRYYNFGFESAAIPSDAAIFGIQVRLDGWVDHAASSPQYDVELSWDGGSSWSNMRSTPLLQNAEDTFYLGGQSDLWGHTWSSSELSDANFRIRITSTDPIWEYRHFFLDWVTVRIHYATAHITGTIWADDNANGVQDGVETGLDNVHVTIFQDDGDGVFEGGGEDSEVGSDDTDVDGAYDTGPFLDGYSYWIEVDEPAGRYLTTPPEPRLVYLPDGNSVTEDFGYAPESTGNPAIEITKGPDSQMIVSGTIAAFTIAVTNTGDVTLTNVLVSDVLAPDCDAGLDSLAPGESADYPCSRANVTSDFTNSATVTGTSPVGSDVSDSDTAFVDVIHPAIEIAKTPDSQMVLYDSTATFTIAVTNTGDVTLTDVRVSDALAPDCDAELDSLVPGESTGYSCSRTNVTSDFTNSATATGTPPVSFDVSDSDTAFVDLIDPAITIAKTPDSQMVLYDATVTFTIAVTNTGGVSLSNVTVSDALAPDCNRPAGNLPDLAPGVSTSYQCIYADVQADFINSATVTATPPLGDDVIDTDTAEVELDRAQICPADMIAYWRLDEVGGPTYDEFYAGHDGECVSSCPASTNGYIHGGQEFDGNSTGIDVPADEAFNWGAEDSFSIEFWMKRPGTPAGNEVVLGRDDGAIGLHWWVGIGHWRGDVTTVCLYETGGTGTCLSGETVVTDGDWHHVVAVRDASENELRLYVDGQEEGVTESPSYSTGFGSPTAALNIGWLNLGGGYHFDGTMDEVALYRRALSRNDVRQHHNEGLVGRWHCQPGTYEPIIVSTPVIDAFVGRSYSYDVEAAGDPAPTYTLIASPTGMEVDPATGLISWTPKLDQEGRHEIVVQASNSEGTDVQEFSVSVATLIAHWKLDETDGPPYRDAYDGHDGACAGECPAPVTGYVSGGQEFDGSSTGIDVPASQDFDWGPGDSFSVEYWIRTDSASTCAGNQVVVGRDDGSTELHWWTGCRDGGQAAFYLGDKSGNGVYVVGTTDLTDGTWHHVVAIRDADAHKIRIRVDGVNEGEASATHTDGFDSPTAALNIGWLNLSQGYHFEGVVDEVALYNVALFAAPLPNQIYLPLVLRN